MFAVGVLLDFVLSLLCVWVLFLYCAYVMELVVPGRGKEVGKHYGGVWLEFVFLVLQHLLTRGFA